MKHLKRNFVFSEEFIEECIKRYPTEFLNEEMKFHSQQKIVSTGKIDLTFEDSSKRIVLVEIQKDAIDKHHLSKIIMYQTSLISEGFPKPRLILFCNRVRENMREIVKDYTEGHSIQLIVVSESDFVKIVEEIDPKLLLFGKGNKYKQLYDTKFDSELSKELNKIKNLEDEKLRANHLEWEEFQIYKKKNEKKVIKCPIFKPIEIYLEKPFDIIEVFEEELERLGIEKQKLIYKTFSHLKCYRSMLHNLIGDSSLRKNLFYLYDINNWNFRDLIDEDGKIRKPKIDIYIYISESYFGKPCEFRVCWKPTEYEMDEFYDLAIKKKGEATDWEEGNDTDWELRDFFEQNRINKKTHNSSFNLLINISEEKYINNISGKTLSHNTYDSNKDTVYVNDNLNGYLACLLKAIYEDLIEKLKHNFDINELNEIELVYEHWEEIDYKFSREQYYETTGRKNTTVKEESKKKVTGYKLLEKELSKEEKEKDMERKQMMEDAKTEAMRPLHEALHKRLYPPEREKEEKKREAEREKELKNKIAEHPLYLEWPEISKEELTKLIWSEPTSKLAKKFGVSDVAVAKKCKRLEIKKPPLGFWAKVDAKKIPHPNGIPIDQK